MRLRIVGGELGRRFLTVPAPLDCFRPTLERSREAVAEIVKNRLAGAIVADLCAGSGAMGFELLSRGAAEVHFIESDRLRAAMIDGFCRSLHVEDRTRVICDDVKRFTSRSEASYDLIYFDPPYENDSLASLIGDLGKLLREGGELLYERRTDRLLEPLLAGKPIKLVQSRCYGDSTIDFLECAAPADKG